MKSLFNNIKKLFGFPVKLQPGPIQKEWIKTLKNHPEMQGKSRLGIKYTNTNIVTCCLGKLGEIAGICIWKDNVLVENTYYKTQRILAGRFREVGLRDCYGSPAHTNREKKLVDLTELNDTLMTWPEIGAHVEKYFDQYFVKSM